MDTATKMSLAHLDLRGRRLFLRVDFNVPLAGETISDDTRIRAVLPTIEHCLKSGASMVLASHLGRPKGTRDPRCYETGFSLVDLNLVDTAKEILAEAAARQVEILLPEDVIVARYPDDRAYVSTQPARTILCATMGLDIGPATAVRFREAVRDAATADIRKAIEQALERRAEREAKRIHVDVRDGIATLTGSVHSWSERKSVVAAARLTPGVRDVEAADRAGLRERRDRDGDPH